VASVIEEWIAASRYYAGPSRSRTPSTVCQSEIEMSPLLNAIEMSPLHQTHVKPGVCRLCSGSNGKFGRQASTTNCSPSSGCGRRKSTTAPTVWTCTARMRARTARPTSGSTDSAHGARRRTTRHASAPRWSGPKARANVHPSRSMSGTFVAGPSTSRGPQDGGQGAAESGEGHEGAERVVGLPAVPTRGPVGRQRLDRPAIDRTVDRDVDGQ
jgi:hypothetical protein